MRGGRGYAWRENSPQSVRARTSRVKKKPAFPTVEYTL